MTRERSPTLPLPAAEPRCEPVQPCVVRGRCARYQAEIQHGSPVRDYTAEHGPGSYLCPGYVDSAALRKGGSAPRGALSIGSEA